VSPRRVAVEVLAFNPQRAVLTARMSIDLDLNAP
jgi:hypothetical protein